MKQLLLILILLLLTGCDAGAPFPTRCRELGVDVPDNAKQTGRIVREIQVENANVECLRPFANPEDKIHERCHALYEVFAHNEAN